MKKTFVKMGFVKTGLVKTGFIAAAMLASSVGPGWAINLPVPPAAPSLYTCNGHSLSRVALSVQPEQPAPCCTGMTGCPQLLANTGLVRPKRDNRT